MLTKNLAVLFKAETSEFDPYVQALKDLSITVATIPVLSFKFINQDMLQAQLNNVKDFSGIIFTSPRSVEAVQNVFHNISDGIKEEWKLKQSFSVGEQTANSAKNLLELDTLGKEAGNSETLCELILKTCTSRENFLFPCSNKRKDTTSLVLQQNGLKVEEIICYQTNQHPEFKENWDALLLEHGVPEIAIFFSPSGVKYSYPLIKSAYSAIVKPKCIAIGPSTGQALQDMNLPFKVAKYPNPLAVLEVLNCFDKELS